VKVKGVLLGIGSVAFACAAAACQDSNASPLATTIDDSRHNHHHHNITTINYDDFSNGATHSDRWFDVGQFLGIGEPEARSSLAFNQGKMTFEATPFTTTFDNGLDHLKHLMMSTRSFDMPLDGWVMVSADIDADTPGCGYHQVPTTHRVLKQSQIAAATLILADAGDTGARFMWWVSDNRAMAVYERAPLDGSCALSTSYTQILGEVSLRGRHHRRDFDHNFAIKYRRDTEDDDNDRDHDAVDWILDGHVRFRVHEVGRPDHGCAHQQITFPAQGPGEELEDRLNSFNIGYGLSSMVDEFPFNACSTGQVSIPANQRLFGQGVSAEYDNFKVETRTQN
jgi:hypothetical protein